MMLEKIKSAIKRINQRFADIKKAVRAGKLPKAAEEKYAAAMRAAAGEENMLPSGNISHGNKAAEAMRSSIEDLERHQTAGQLKKAMERQVKEAQEEDPDYSEADYMSDYDFVTEAQADDPDECYEAYNKAWGGKSLGSRPSYSMLRGAIEAFRSGGRRQPVNVVERIFEGL